jgi:hypothetical protein
MQTHSQLRPPALMLYCVKVDGSPIFKGGAIPVSLVGRPDIVGQIVGLENRKSADPSF